VLSHGAEEIAVNEVEAEMRYRRRFVIHGREAFAVW
jgi:hypothetical protein